MMPLSDKDMPCAQHFGLTTQWPTVGVHLLLPTLPMQQPNFEVGNEMRGRPHTAHFKVPRLYIAQLHVPAQSYNS